MSALAIRLRGVVKRYGTITAVDGLDLDLAPGVCLGLLGPNGAGKSTTMRMLTALAIPDAGELEVLGFEVPKDSKQARAMCGVVPQLDNLDVELTARQNLAVFARLYRVPHTERRAAVDRALTIAKLTERADTPVDKLSGGMRRRLLIARALVHRPRLLLLDEPTVGLDVQSRRFLIEHVRGLCAERGVGVLWATHLVDESSADSRIVLLRRGRVAAASHAAELVREAGNRDLAAVLDTMLREGTG